MQVESICVSTSLTDCNAPGVYQAVMRWLVLTPPNRRAVVNDRERLVSSDTGMKNDMLVVMNDPQSQRDRSVRSRMMQLV